jgi:oligopeptidase B
VVSLPSGESHRITFPEPVYSAFPGINAEFDTPAFRFAYQSFVTPSSVFDYEPAARRSVLRKQDPVLGGYDPARYATGRLWATAADGVRVPVSVVSRRDVPRDGSAPLLLTGYGAYGYPLPVTFSSARLSLLDRGVVVALAHVRGGGEFGEPWHDAGKMLAKMNSFTDFVSAAELLVAEGWTAPSRLIVQGGSAGGLLVGAAINLRPELFRAAVLQVPFLDVIATMLDTTLPLTVGEFEEWGDPRVREQYESMRRYCPYTNIARTTYPAMLVRTAFNDSQVMYWEPAKYVARMRATRTDANPVLLQVNMAAGHGGASGRYDALREVAFDYAFMLWQWGLADRG